jgi:hypothetical protein
MTRWGSAVAVWAVASVVAMTAVVGLTPAPAGAAAPVAIAGTVTADLGGPVAGVRVRLYRDGVGYLEHYADTATNGTWTIPGIPAGSYRVVFTDPTLGHVTEWWGDTVSRTGSTVVTLGPDDDVVLDVALAPAASVTGTITAAGAFDVYLYAGDPATTSATQVLRAQTGTFSFAGLPAGTYRVLVKDPTGVAKDLWYPNRVTRAEALPITLSTGQAFTSTYRHPAPGIGAIEGVVIDSEGPVAGVVVQAYNSLTGVFVRSGRTDEDGEYRIPSLPAGCYKPVFRDPTGAHVTAWDGSGDVVTNVFGPCVGANSTVTVDRELMITSTLAGVVTGGDTPLAGIRVALYREGATVRSVTTAADGTWSAAGLEPGSYTVGYSDPSRTFVPEYHQDRSRLADATPIAVEPFTTIDIQAVLAQR